VCACTVERVAEVRRKVPVVKIGSNGELLAKGWDFLYKVDTPIVKLDDTPP